MFPFSVLIRGSGFFFLSSRWRWWMMIHSMAGSASLFTFVGVRFVPFLFFFLGFRRRQRFVGRRKKIARRKKKKKKKRRKNGVPIHSLAFVELLAPFGSKYFEKLFLFFFFEFGLRRWFGSFFLCARVTCVERVGHSNANASLSQHLAGRFFLFFCSFIFFF